MDRTPHLSMGHAGLIFGCCCLALFLLVLLSMALGGPSPSAQQTGSSPTTPAPAVLPPFLRERYSMANPTPWDNVCNEMSAQAFVVASYRDQGLPRAEIERLLNINAPATIQSYHALLVTTVFTYPKTVPGDVALAVFTVCQTQLRPPSAPPKPTSRPLPPPSTEEQSARARLQDLQRRLQER